MVRALRFVAVLGLLAWAGRVLVDAARLRGLERLAGHCADDAFGLEEVA